VLAVGLGNPEEEFGGSRHNLGADVVHVLAARHGGKLKKTKERALADEVRVDGRLLALAFPQTYMNLSGESVARLVRRYGIEDFRRLVIVHDELDLPVARVRVKVGGGIAGHNGLASVRQHLKSTDFVRVRIGVDKPPGRRQGADHVLRRPSKAEREALEVAVEVAADAVEAILLRGPDAAMNEFNGRE
jgi:PTH1 family peptidyl-tRNA hydrolase